MFVYHMTYSVAGIAPELHQMRDCAASNELLPALIRKGYEYGTAIHCYPGRLEAPGAFSFLHPADALLMTTRPAVDDWQLNSADNRGIIRNSNYLLERVVLFSLLSYFDHLSRVSVNWSRHTAALLPSTTLASSEPSAARDALTAQPASVLANIEFHRYVTAYMVKAYARGTPSVAATPIKVDDRFSATYFIHLPEIPLFGCRLIACWGMSGYETLLWCRQVRLRFSRWLDEPTLAVVLWQFPDQETHDAFKKMPVQPPTPMIADTLSPRWVFEHQLDASLLKAAFMCSSELLEYAAQANQKWTSAGQAVAYARRILTKLNGG